MPGKLGDFNLLELEESQNKIIINGTTFRYIFDKSNGLIEQIKVLNTPLLGDIPAPSLYLSAEIDPRTKAYEAHYEKNARCEVLKESSEEIVIRSEGKYCDLKGDIFPMKYVIEYEICFDGVIKVTVNNIALGDSAIRWLCFARGALNPGFCEYLTYLPDLSFTERTGIPNVEYLSFEEGKQILGGRFIPWFHLGNDYVGFEVAVCDATNISYGWTDTSPYKTGDPLGKAGENFILYMSKGKVYWEIFSLRNLYTVIYPGWKRENIFYIAVVPAKHYNPAYANLRVHWEGPHQFNPNYTYPSDEKIKKLAQHGINLIVGCINYRSGEYSKVDNPDETRRVIEACHKYRVKIIPYVTFTDLEHRTETFKLHGEEWQIEPVAEFNYRTNLMCYGAEGWREHWKREVSTILDSFNFDGLYIDFWSGKVACRNPRHGCNTRYIRFTLDGLRDMAKYAYKMLKSRNPNLFILANTNVFPCAMVNNFVDIRLLGEWWNVEETDPKMIRAFHNCFKFGCNNLLLTGRIDKITKKSVAFSQAYHGPMVMTRGRGRSDEETDILLNHANLLRFFGIDRAECISSFISRDYIFRDPDHLIVSLYRNDMGLLLAVTNLSSTDVEAHIAFKDPSKMGINDVEEYLLYRPDKRCLLSDTPLKGKEVSHLTIPVEAFSPALVYITKNPKGPKLIYASNFDFVKDEKWNEEESTLSFYLVGVEGAKGQATIYCPNIPPKKITLEEKPVKYFVNGRLAHLEEVEAMKLIKVKF